MIPNVQVTPRLLPETEAFKMLHEMGVGINIGDTFDACVGEKFQGDPLTIETAWRGVYTTRDMIRTFKAAGFATVRLPVSWHNHFVDDDFTIDSRWMARISEVIGWILDEGMTAILNTHHDISPKCYYPSGQHLDISLRYIRNVWRQLAELFRDAGPRLIFESMNEPRLAGHPNEWKFDIENPDCLDAVHCINQLNQAFVDTVRQVGGENAQRYLMVPSYAASPLNTVVDAFTLPKDSANDKIIVSIHSYTPYRFALAGPDEEVSVDTFTLDNKEQCGEVLEWMDAIYDRFTKNGVPVVIGEFGFRNKNNLQCRVDATAFYCANASARGLPCVWWDNCVFGPRGEIFVLLDRKELRWVFPEIVEALMQYAKR